MVILENKNRKKCPVTRFGNIHSVHTGGRSGGGGNLLLHAAWRHGARIEEPPPPCRVPGQLERV